MKGLLLAALTPLPSGCIVFEDAPRGDFNTQVEALFLPRCQAAGYERAVGCALTCGGGGSPALGAEDELLRFAGAGAVYAADTGQPFDARCGTASWRVCTQNVYGGVDCEEKTRRYCTECTEEGVRLADEGGGGAAVPTFPADVIGTSVLPSMMEARFVGEPGSCLAACVAAVSRPACGACDASEGCLDTGFGEVCFPRGPRVAGEPCAGPQSCASLSCDAEAATCL